MKLSAPLPFMGQKRMFAKEYIKVLKNYPDNALFVDLFGGSGLLSHIAKRIKPSATVIYNDYDNYRLRLSHIPDTNRLLADLRSIAEGCERHKPITGKKREEILSRIEQESYVDFITISSSLTFSMKYVMNMDSLKKETLYNNIRKQDFPLNEDYLDGIEIVSCDYKELFDQYKDDHNAVFLIDPPYLSTEVGTYTMSWGLSDYLDVLRTLVGTRYIYFTSNKSSIIELCEWMGNNQGLGNPFTGCERKEFNAHMNYSSAYTDIMLYN